MSWSTTATLRAEAARLWERGELLRAVVGAGRIEWPQRLRFKAPGTADLGARFEAVREWVAAIAKTPHVRLEWRARAHRVQGRQELPAAAWLDSPQAALAWLGRSREAETFRALHARTAAVQPALLAWLERRPLAALELAADWARLLAVVGWLQAHPRPGVHLREVDLPGVHSKFIEAHRGVLGELLELALPPEAIAPGPGGVAQFARRFGFLEKPRQLRFRLLDAALPSLPGCRGLADITLDAASFATLALPLQRAFVTENETNFLAFPPFPGAIVIFGAGYGWEALAGAAWLGDRPLHYWGDIDTHGFAILDSLRSHFPHAASFLMDRATLLAHREHWGEEPEPVRHELTRLAAEEAALYDALRHDSLGPRVRLEQERIGFGHLRAALARISAAGDA